MPEDIVLGVAALIGLGVFFYGPWQWLCTDVARQILFERRDAIFDMARAGKLSFESEEYRTIRHSLEKSIRFAHDLTLPRFLYELRVRGFLRKSDQSNLRSAIERIGDAKVREEVRDHVSHGLSALTAIMLVRSPLFLLLVPVVALLLLAMMIAFKAMPSLSKRVLLATRIVRDMVQREAEQHGPDGAPA